MGTPNLAILQSMKTNRFSPEASSMSLLPNNNYNNNKNNNKKKKNNKYFFPFQNKVRNDEKKKRV